MVSRNVVHKLLGVYSHIFMADLFYYIPVSVVELFWIFSLSVINSPENWLVGWIGFVGAILFTQGVIYLSVIWELLPVIISPYDSSVYYKP